MLKESEILRFIEEDKTSTKKHLASAGRRYYKEVTSKSVTPFFTELVGQAVRYI